MFRDRIYIVRRYFTTDRRVGLQFDDGHLEAWVGKVLLSVDLWFPKGKGA